MLSIPNNNNNSNYYYNSNNTKVCISKGWDTAVKKMNKSTTFYLLLFAHSLQCFDAVGWAAGRASGL